MAKLLKIDVSALPTHKERYKILEMFGRSFDVNVDWYVLDPLHKTFDYFEAFWAFNSPPPLPQVPDAVKITEQ